MGEGYIEWLKMKFKKPKKPKKPKKKILHSCRLGLDNEMPSFDCRKKLSPMEFHCMTIEKLQKMKFCGLASGEILR